MAEYNRFNDFRDQDYDDEERRSTHLTLFGHEPPRTRGEQCQHPIHAQIRRDMNDMTLEIPFDPAEIITDDSELAKAGQDRYDYIYGQTREFQQAVEEEEKWENARKMGLILPGKLF